MRTIAAGIFKAHCLSLMDEVQSKRSTILITKHGKPAAKLVPAEETVDDVFGFMAGKAKIRGNVVAPIVALEEWDLIG